MEVTHFVNQLFDASSHAETRFLSEALSNKNENTNLLWFTTVCLFPAVSVG